MAFSKAGDCYQHLLQSSTASRQRTPGKAGLEGHLRAAFMAWEMHS